MYGYSNAYWSLVRWKEAADPLFNACAKVLRVSFKVLFITFLIVKALLKAHLPKLLRPLGRALRALVRGLGQFAQEVLRALIKPVLTVVGLTALFVVGSNMKHFESSLPQAVAIPATHIQALLKPAPPKPAPSRNMALLARFHGSEQSFPTEGASIGALADALNIPASVVKENVPRAMALADSNTSAMRKHLGRFPLPATTSPRLLAALTPSDVDHLALLLDYAATLGKKEVTLQTQMPSGDLALETTVTDVQGGCFRYLMTFTRRTFRHATTATACRKGSVWSFPEKRSIP